MQHCGKGIGWWMLVLMVGLFVAGAGAVVSGMSTMAIPILFVAIGAPFVALALRSGNTQLLLGASPSTGKLFAGIFGACFVIAGVIWGTVAGHSSVSRVAGGLRFGGVLASLVGVGLGFAVAAGVASAIGPSAPTRLQQVSGDLIQSSSPGWQSRAAAGQTSAAIGQANAAITQATAQAERASKLAACVTAAGTNTAQIQACEVKYMP